MRRIQLFVLGIMAVTLMASHVYAADSITKKENLPWQQPLKEQTGTTKADTIHRAEQYLNQLQTMVSSFVQVAPDGTISEGKFYLSRPGKLRWEYFPPAQVTIVANKGLITYYDAELDQVSHTSVDSTPLVFLTERHIDLSKGDITVEKVAYDKAITELTLTQKNKEDEGNIVLTFTNNPLALKKMAVVNPIGEQTVVTFTDAVFSESLDNKLFYIENPHLFKKRRN